MQTWQQLPPETMEGRECASANCDGVPVVNFTAGDVGSDYCAACAWKIEHMRVQSAASNREIDELENTFGQVT